jgi:hypothetical protein
MGAKSVSLDAGHASMVSHPRVSHTREIAAMLMDAARTG